MALRFASLSETLPAGSSSRVGKATRHFAERSAWPGFLKESFPRSVHCRSYSRAIFSTGERPPIRLTLAGKWGGQPAAAALSREKRGKPTESKLGSDVCSSALTGIVASCKPAENLQVVDLVKVWLHWIDPETANIAHESIRASLRGVKRSAGFRSFAQKGRGISVWLTALDGIRAC